MPPKPQLSQPNKPQTLRTRFSFGAVNITPILSSPTATQAQAAPENSHAKTTPKTPPTSNLNLLEQVTAEMIEKLKNQLWENVECALAQAIRDYEESVNEIEALYQTIKKKTEAEQLTSKELINNALKGLEANGLHYNTLLSYAKNRPDSKKLGQFKTKSVETNFTKLAENISTKRDELSALLTRLQSAEIRNRKTQAQNKSDRFIAPAAAINSRESLSTDVAPTTGYQSASAAAHKPIVNHHHEQKPAQRFTLKLLSTLFCWPCCSSQVKADDDPSNILINGDHGAQPNFQ